jgi:hypothetical protein
LFASLLLAMGECCVVCLAVDLQQPSLVYLFFSLPPIWWGRREGCERV